MKIKQDTQSKIEEWNNDEDILTPEILKCCLSERHVELRVSSIIALIGNEPFLDQDLFSKIFQYTDFHHDDIYKNYLDVIRAFQKCNFLSKESLSVAPDYIEVPIHDKWLFNIMIVSVSLLHEKSLLSISNLINIWSVLHFLNKTTKITLPAKREKCQKVIENYIEAFERLHDQGILNELSLNFLKKSITFLIQKNPYENQGRLQCLSLAMILVNLFKINLLHQKNLDLLLSKRQKCFGFHNKNFEIITGILEQLFQSENLSINQELFDSIINFKKPHSLQEAIKLLIQTGRLNQLELGKLLSYNEPHFTVKILDHLVAHNLLTETNYQSVIASQKPSSLANILNTIKHMRIAEALTQEQLDNLFVYADLLDDRGLGEILEPERPLRNVFNCIPPSLFNLDHILAICREYHPHKQETLQALAHYIQKLFNIVPQSQQNALGQQQIQNQLNPAQNTYRAMVHKEKVTLTIENSSKEVADRKCPRDTIHDFLVYRPDQIAALKRKRMGKTTTEYNAPCKEPESITIFKQLLYSRLFIYAMEFGAYRYIKSAMRLANAIFFAPNPAAISALLQEQKALLEGPIAYIDQMHYDQTPGFYDLICQLAAYDVPLFNKEDEEKSHYSMQ